MQSTHPNEKNKKEMNCNKNLWWLPNQNNNKIMFMEVEPSN